MTTKKRISDKERLDWLFEHHLGYGENVHGGGRCIGYFLVTALDRTQVDAAIQSERKEKARGK